MANMLAARKDMRSSSAPGVVPAVVQGAMGCHDAAMKNSYARRFLVRPGRKLKLARCPTDVPKLYRNEKDAEEQLARQVARTS